MSIRNDILKDIVAAEGGTVTQPVTRNSLLKDWLDALTSAFAPLDLFQSGEQGAWYDPSDLSTLFQDSDGTTAVIADGDPVGLMLDKSRQLDVGPELVLNGDFTTDTANWISGSNATLSVVDSKLRVTNTDTASSYGYQSMTVEVGKTYKVKVTAHGGTRPWDLRVGTGQAASNIYREFTSGFKDIEFVFVASNTNLTTSLFINGGTTDDYVEWDNVSITELAGNPALQPTSASRPTYDDTSSIYSLEFDQVDDVMTVEMPDLGTDATLAYADDTGVTILTAQTISGSTDLPTPDKLYGAIYVDRALTASETTGVTNYLNELRGV